MARKCEGGGRAEGRWVAEVSGWGGAGVRKARRPPWRKLREKKESVDEMKKCVEKKNQKRQK